MDHTNSIHLSTHQREILQHMATGRTLERAVLTDLTNEEPSETMPTRLQIPTLLPGSWDYLTVRSPTLEALLRLQVIELEQVTLGDILKGSERPLMQFSTYWFRLTDKGRAALMMAEHPRRKGTVYWPSTWNYCGLPQRKRSAH